MYNILVVDDSALMRKLMCDIINSIDGYHVSDVCADGKSAYLYLKQKNYSAVTMNMAMPSFNGISILTKIKEEGLSVPVIAISSSLKEDRELAIKAMELGAVDFVLRPLKVNSPEMESFRSNLKIILESAVEGKVRKPKTILDFGPVDGASLASSETKVLNPKYDLVAIASSTGGPQALQVLVPMLPARLGVPVVIVQHMPVGFTSSLAERVDHKSKIKVKEARNGEPLKIDTVYIAKGGHQMKVAENKEGQFTLAVTTDPPVNNLRPCADVMYESLCNLSYKKILCVVLTGMGSDGAKGISSLKKKKRIKVLTQSEKTCVVYGMPKAAFEGGLSDVVCDIGDMAKQIVKELGV